MIKFNEIPLVRLLLPFIGGILLSVYSGVYFPTISLLSAVFVLLVFVYYLKRLGSYRYRWLPGATINILYFLCGIALLQENTLSRKRDYFQNIQHSPGEVMVRLVEPVVEKARSVKTVADIVAVKQSGSWISCRGKTILYFKKNSNSLNLNYGDVVITRSALTEINSPQNPSEFDYKRYLSFHNIQHQCYSSEKDWKRVGANGGNWLVTKAIELRQNLLKVLKDNGVKEQEFAVASALILGYEDDLDTDLISAYSSSGALHVLSVSGLHVAIIFIVFNFFLSFFDRLKRGAIIKGIILIILLWGYALISGLSPSVMRAATMFSFIILGKALRRDANIFNILAASALLLLCYNPYLVMEVGFQLSYLAVIGIVLLQKPIYNLLDINNYLLDKIWAITAVSIAAQLITFPLGLLYFHQFPNYFLISNLVVIPVSTVALYLGIALFAFSGISLLAGYLGKVLSATVELLNFSVFYTDGLPYAIIQGVSISVFETWMMYSCIIFLIIYFFNKIVTYFKVSLIILAGLLFIQVMDAIKEQQQKEIMVYAVKKSTAIDLIDGHSNILIADSLLQHNDKKLLFHIKHNWWEKGLTDNLVSNISDTLSKNNILKKGNNIQFLDKKVFILDRTFSFNKRNSLQADVLVISGSPKINLKGVRKYFDVKTIVADGTNSLKQVKEWEKESKDLNLNFHSVAMKGAFSYKF